MKKENFMDNRPGWDEYFMEMAVLTARRSTCLRRHVGAVIVQEKHIVATGYNGAPEQNAIIQAATLGQSIEGATIYITHQPCIICAKMIINAGIRRIVVKEGYPDEMSVGILQEAGLKIVMLGEA